jgi:succinoglycan biosynthesis transport protein ExoP
MKKSKNITGRVLDASPAPNMDQDDDFDIDLRALLSKLWRGRWIIIICVLFAGVFGFLTASQYEPRFRASSKVMFDPPNAEIIDLGGGAVAPMRQDGLQDQIEVLRSSNLALRVVQDLNLIANPEFNPRLRPEQVTLWSQAQELIAVPDWALEQLRDMGILPPPPPPEPEIDPEEISDRELRSVVENVLSNLVTQPVPNSRVLTISFESGSPEMAARVANAFAEQYIVDQLNARLEATRAATTWLSGRVDELRERVQAAEEEVEEARAQLSFQAGQSLQITREQLQALNATLSVARNATRVAEATYSRLATALESEADYGSVPEFRAAETIAANRARRADLLSERTVLLETVDAQHPAIARIDRLLEEARRAMREEAQQVVEAAQMRWVSLQQEEKDIEEDVRELETLALEQSQDEVMVRQLEREAEASRALYENFLSRLQETSEQQRLEEPNARILTQAEPPLAPLTQKKNRTLLVAVSAGAVLGVAIIFLIEKLNNTFRSIPQLESATGETVLGIIPTIGRKVRRRSVLDRFREKPKGSLAEAVRSLRTSILFSDVDNPPQVVMFTSSVPREGKSTTAMLVAMTSRQMGKTAIIVDCDLRLPALADLLGTNDDKPGLLSAIDGTATVDQAIYQDEDTGLHVLMTKKSEPRSSVNAADILSSKKFSDMIEGLKKQYDLVILDTPPTLAVADPRILAAYADAIVYVVRWDSTPRGAVDEGLKELTSVNAPIAGVVMSLVNETKASRYSYEGYSYYRAQYRNYYSD